MKKNMMHIAGNATDINTTSATLNLSASGYIDSIQSVTVLLYDDEGESVKIPLTDDQVDMLKKDVAKVYLTDLLESITYCAMFKIKFSEKTSYNRGFQLQFETPST